MKRKLFGMVLGLGVLASVVLSAPSAHATYNAYLYQDGVNVVASGSGSFNLTALTSQPTNWGGGVNPSFNALLFSPNSPSDTEALYSGISGPVNFGSGGFTSPSTNNGPIAGISAIYTGSIITGIGYVSGTLLGTSTMTFDNTTLSGLGVTTGNYSWTWGTGGNADSFNLFIGTAPNSSPSATPEPSTWVLFGTGILAMMGWTYRRQKALQS